MRNRRASRSSRIRLSISVLCGFALAFFAWIAWVDGHAIVISLIDRLPLGKQFAPDIESHYASYPAIVLGLLGGAVTWQLSDRLAKRLHDRFFSPYYHELITKIPPPRSFDPLRGSSRNETGSAMPWRLSTTGERSDAWFKLLGFATNDAGRSSLELKPRVIVPFDWIILMGPPGSGKSRLAVQVAYRLARRPDDGGHRVFSRLQRISSWWRIEVCLRGMRKADPWDTGWLQAGFAATPTAYPERTLRFSLSDILEELPEWRPRRPTLLIIDDPLNGDCSKAIDAFQKASNEYLHAVRLIIVNQTAPLELGYVFSDGKLTNPGRSKARNHPVYLGHAARFDTHDIKALAKRTFTESELALFETATRGNPLLVEIAIEALRDGVPLDKLSEEELLAHRASTIIDALKQAGFDSDTELRAFAVASIAGGLAGEFAKKYEIKAAFHLLDDGPEHLGRVFPIEHEELRNKIPPIRPELVADAFVGKVLLSASDEDRRAMVATAWRASPMGTLRTALRVAGGTNELAALLSKEPEEIYGAVSEAITLAYFNAALLQPTAQSPVNLDLTYSFAIRRMAMQRAQRLDSKAAEDAWLHLSGTAALPLGTVRVRTWIELCSTVLCQLASNWEKSVDPVDDFLSVADEFLKKASAALAFFAYPEPSLFDSLQKMWARVAALASNAEQVERLVSFHAEHRRSGIIIPLIKPLHEAIQKLKLDPSRCGEGFNLLVRQPLLENEINGEGYAFAHSIASRFSDGGINIDIARGLCRAWLGASQTIDIAVCDAAAENAAALATQFPEDSEIRIILAEVWQVVAALGSTLGNHIIALKASTRLATLAERGRSERDFDLLHCMTLRYATNACWKAGEYAASESCCAALCDIASRYLDDVDINYEKLNALGFASKTSKDIAQILAAEVRLANDRFPANRKIQAERSHWLGILVEYMETDAGRLECANETERLVMLFPDDPNIAAFCAAAWVNVAIFHSRHAETRREYFTKAFTLVAPYDGKSVDVDRSLIYEAYARTCLRGNFDDCSTIVDEMQKLLSLYPSDLMVNLSYCSIVSTACGAAVSDQRNGVEVGLERGLRTAELLESRVESIRNSIALDAQSEQTLDAYRVSAWARNAWGSRFRKTQCSEFVRRVEAIAAAYPLTAIPIQHDLLFAWKVEAFSLQHDLAERRLVVARMEDLAARLPKHESVTEYMAEAVDQLAFAARSDIRRIPLTNENLIEVRSQVNFAAQSKMAEWSVSLRLPKPAE